MVIVTKTPHEYIRVTYKYIRVHTGPPRGGGGQGGQLAPGPKQEGAPNLKNILKLNKASSKSGRVQGINGCIKRHWRPRLEVFSTLWSTVHWFLVLLFENNDVIGAPNKILPRAPRVFSAALSTYK